MLLIALLFCGPVPSILAAIPSKRLSVLAPARTEQLPVQQYLRHTQEQEQDPTSLLEDVPEYRNPTFDDDPCTDVQSCSDCIKLFVFYPRGSGEKRYCTWDSLYSFSQQALNAYSQGWKGLGSSGDFSTKRGVCRVDRAAGDVEMAIDQSKSMFQQMEYLKSIPNICSAASQKPACFSAGRWFSERQHQVSGRTDCTCTAGLWTNCIEIRPLALAQDKQADFTDKNLYPQLDF
eukprot:gb/GEZN01018252.1/.p1 GENE.gb/GEZN01018252.1/~~gb/GEZN01018252.1/.p1  ORF type:complete len:233 (+),score=22.68 gb/GEZN01018252.1/:25-723(+)